VARIDLDRERLVFRIVRVNKLKRRVAMRTVHVANRRQQKLRRIRNPVLNVFAALAARADHADPDPLVGSVAQRVIPGGNRHARGRAGGFHETPSRYAFHKSGSLETLANQHTPTPRPTLTDSVLSARRVAQRWRRRRHRSTARHYSGASYEHGKCPNRLYRVYLAQSMDVACS